MNFSGCLFYFLKKILKNKKENRGVGRKKREEKEEEEGE